MDKVRVAVRVRPLNQRELDLRASSVLSIVEKQAVLYVPDDADVANCKENKRRAPKTFAFDHCFDSRKESSASFADQSTVFTCLGTDVLDSAFQGYNACILAYGQTGSGKSYTMMGSSKDLGLIPRLCNELFSRIDGRSDSTWSAKVEVSYMEIYNEKVLDLLNPTTRNLRVREHNVLGPYVDGLARLAVSSFTEIEELMVEGNKSRTVASTNMNAESSRSHAVFSVVLTQTLVDEASGVSGEKVSKISLVDLAGSERAVKTGAVGDRLKEGSNINKSLTTLGLVISKLADSSNTNKNERNAFVPYRDSTLTWLLKDNLGGNSRTVMVATVSPSGDNYEETLSTLRYADRAKRIVNHAIVNEDPNAKIIRELRAELEQLKQMLKHAAQPEVLRDQLSENEKLMKELSLTWEEKLQKTSETHEDRRHALEKAGISVDSSGIKVKDKFFLVNLSSDPSMNELLVYYLKPQETRIGNAVDSDIMLRGIGIEDRHCTIFRSKRDVEESSDNSLQDTLTLMPQPNARTCVNGVEVRDEAIRLYNGDRIVWGSNHYFRVHCPKCSESDPSTPALPFDFDMAQEELIAKASQGKGIQNVIADIERHYYNGAQNSFNEAFLKQRRVMDKNGNPINNATTSISGNPADIKRIDGNGNTKLWQRQSEESLKASLKQLRSELFLANGLVREANLVASKVAQDVHFSVTLQIPPHNLSPNRKRNKFISEPAILVRRKGHSNQLFSVDQLESKLLELRSSFINDSINEFNNPFYEVSQPHELIGVANMYLKSLLISGEPFEYQVPIISQQGELAGRLRVRLQRLKGSFDFLLLQQGQGQARPEEDDHVDRDDDSLVIEICIRGASGLPPSLSHFVFCEYSFLDNETTIAAPTCSPRVKPSADYLPGNFEFEHREQFKVEVSDELLDLCNDGALSIEVYGNKAAGFDEKYKWNSELQRAKATSLADRWSELTRQLEFGVEIQELNDQGCYAPVEVELSDDCGTGGVYQLRQGQQRKLVVFVRPVSMSGTLPLVCDSVQAVYVGSPCSRNKVTQKALDSYQEEDLTRLREKWSQALDRRRVYLDSQMKRLSAKDEALKTDSDLEREKSLVEQWVCLTEERNSVLLPIKGVPGAPAQNINRGDGVEDHRPVLFLDLDADDLAAPGFVEVPGCGEHSILPKEHNGVFFALPIIQYTSDEIGAVATWDSSIHDSLALNRITPNGERVYLIVKAVVRLSHPLSMDLVVRKRICFNVYKRHSLTNKLMRNLLGSNNPSTATSVIYEIVSSIPKVYQKPQEASEELEERGSLAAMAASEVHDEDEDDLGFIEQYTKAVAAVEKILSLDKLRQEVALKELLDAKIKTPTVYQQLSLDDCGQYQSLNSHAISNTNSMKKTYSVPDMNQSSILMASSSTQENLLSLLRPSDSFYVINDIPKASTKQDDTDSAENNWPGSPLGSVSMKKSTSSRIMSTLVEEEDGSKGNTTISDNASSIKDTSSTMTMASTIATSSGLRASHTIESLHHEEDAGTEKGTDSASKVTVVVATMTPSMTSSGYGSQAFSSNTLSSSQDSLPSHQDQNEEGDYDQEDQDEDDEETTTVVETTPTNTMDTATVRRRQKSRLTTTANTRKRFSFPSDPSSRSLRESGPVTKGQSCDVIQAKSNDNYLPDWLKVGESIQLRPSNSSGIVSFLGQTQFAKGLWIGVTLDAPTGKNDGSVQGVHYFTCPPRHGVFVRPDKVKLDRRGRAMRRN